MDMDLWSDVVMLRHCCGVCVLTQAAHRAHATLFLRLSVLLVVDWPFV
jgi:hypothetical protein